MSSLKIDQNTHTHTKQRNYRFFDDDEDKYHNQVFSCV